MTKRWRVRECPIHGLLRDTPGIHFCEVQVEDGETCGLELSDVFVVIRADRLACRERP